ncbi:MAG: ABC transporter ATP-binding protein [Planctomycetes bacterium]|nr:ABC transporter ATP-binding protein [Planctomycetota bacterium]
MSSMTPAAPPISLRGVSKWYGPVIGVNGVTLEVEPGITGLLGPNGAGKTTLMKLITGQLRPSVGEALVFGRSVWSRPDARRHVGFSPEVDAFHEEMTGREFVTAMARLSGIPRREARRRAEGALERTGMLDRCDKRLRACSKGMRQRIKISQALVHDPAVLVLDEPLSGIDPPGRIELMGLLRDLAGERKTILLSTHILHEVEAVTERIVLMARGRVLAAGYVGQIRELLAEHPLTVRIACDRRRVLAAALVGLESVAGVALGAPASAGEPEGGDGPGDVVVKVRRAGDFFRRLPSVVLEQGAEVERVEALDASVEAVFGYLVSGAGYGGYGGHGWDGGSSG